MLLNLKANITASRLDNLHSRLEALCVTEANAPNTFTEGFCLGQKRQLGTCTGLGMLLRCILPPSPFCLLGGCFPSLFGQAEPWGTPAHPAPVGLLQVKLREKSFKFSRNRTLPGTKSSAQHRSAPWMARRGKAS